MSYLEYRTAQTFREHFDFLYPDRGENCLARLQAMLGRYGVVASAPGYRWSEKDIAVITYGDILRRNGEHPLLSLKSFLDSNFLSCINTVHILPFFPYSSDDGFSITDYRRVNPSCGSWDEIQSLAENYRLMFDLVLNHASRDSAWFEDFIHRIMPARDFFIEADPAADLSAVVRPRATPLLTPVQTREGLRHVWTTFSEDQVDLDFANPDVLFEFLDILLFYISKGAKIIRLDAIAYTWKKAGTSCIHLPECHRMVRLFRDFLDLVAPDVLILTETNVPHEENISYFGGGDEAHLVYQFSLPPLLLHAFDAESGERLSAWAASLPTLPAGCSFFNFTASHDGVGLRPLEGLVPEEQIADLARRVADRGGRISARTNPDGSESPYEMNCTYLDALAEKDGKLTPGAINRFLSTQAAALAMKGLPAVYFHSLVGTRNYYEGIRRYGFPRAINRRRWDADRLEKFLADDASHHRTIFDACRRMLRIRSSRGAFHPDGRQEILEAGKSLFAIRRTDPAGEGVVVSVTNFSRRAKKLKTADLGLDGGPARDLLENAEVGDGNIQLPGGKTAWLTVG